MTSKIPFSARTVIESDSVTQYIEKQKEFFPRLDEVINALIWRLARNPSEGVPIFGQTKTAILKFNIWQGVAGSHKFIAVLYSWDDNEVVLKAIRLIQ